MKKEKEKTKWGEFVTPVFMSCYDTLCHDLGSPPGDTSGHLIGSPILYIGYIVYTFYVQYIVRYQIYQTYEVRSLMVAEQSNDLQRKILDDQDSLNNFQPGMSVESAVRTQ